MSSSSGLLLDLGILMRLRGASPDPVIAEFLHRRRHQRMFISALTLCELSAQAQEHAPAGGTTASEDGWLQELAERFAANILPVDHHIALACEQHGPRSQAILAATARHHHLTVVSVDASGYAGFDVGILDPLAIANEGRRAAQVPAG